MLDSLINWPVFSVPQVQKERILFKNLQYLTKHHSNSCMAYNQILLKLWKKQKFSDIESLPFLPVRLFKHETLLSIPRNQIIKTLTSSGTSGQKKSQIFLDKQTSSNQIKVLSKIMTEFIGPKRLPMLVIDSRATLENRLKFSARTAGILGFSIFGREVEFALDDNMSLNEKRINKFISKYQDQPILIFGFTFIVWKHFIRWLEANKKNIKLDRGILIHGGGWKQLESEAVEKEEFKSRLKSVTGITKVHNYYGMVEQTGSIFMECEHGNMHPSIWSDIIIRSSNSFNPAAIGEIGLIQLLSVIPHSYPGHSLLTEDVGVLLGIDDCNCGRKGKYFKVIGRIEKAEIRGCSDTYTQ